KQLADTVGSLHHAKVGRRAHDDDVLYLLLNQEVVDLLPVIRDAIERRDGNFRVLLTIEVPHFSRNGIIATLSPTRYVYRHRRLTSRIDWVVHANWHGGLCETRQPHPFSRDGSAVLVRSSRGRVDDHYAVIPRSRNRAVN